MLTSFYGSNSMDFRKTNAAILIGVIVLICVLLI